MNIGAFIKQPAETIDYDISYADWLIGTDTVESANVVAAPDTISVYSVFITNDRIKIWVSGGEANVSYKLTATMTTEDGRVREDEFIVRVKDI